MAYPKALSQMPYGAPVWSVLFFFMLCLLGIDSEVRDISLKIWAQFNNQNL